MKIVRTRSAGVFAAAKVNHDPTTGVAKLRDARRLWYWSGAATLSELAMRGVAKPSECKFPVPVEKVTVAEVIEVISMTAEAEASVRAVPVWSEQ